MLPTFLIIGAMKAGTTTLYMDLLANPSVYFPLDKEPGGLDTLEVLSSAGRRDYERHFASARPDQVRGDASTDYAKSPDTVGVPQRALEVLGPDVRIIYLVRDPIARIRSHHRHEFAMGRANDDINAEVGEDPAYLNYSLYAMQIRPWMETFGLDNIRIIQFEDYVSRRASVIAEVSGFLGVKHVVQPAQSDSIYNDSRHLPVLSPGWRKVQRSSIYQTLLRPALGPNTRRRIRHATLKPPELPQAVIKDDTLRYLRRRLLPDVEELTDIVALDLALWKQTVPQE